jgi:3D (Asp-Asp-Asp) domain-containing protein
VRVSPVAWIVLGVIVLTVGLIAIFAGPFILGVIQTREVLAHGVPAQALIIGMTDTGTRINDVPLIAIKVEVMPVGARPYIAVFQRTLTVADADEFHRGNIIQVKFDAAHPNRVAAVLPGS